MWSLLTNVTDRRIDSRTDVKRSHDRYIAKACSGKKKTQRQKPASDTIRYGYSVKLRFLRKQTAIFATLRLLFLFRMIIVLYIVITSLNLISHICWWWNKRYHNSRWLHCHSISLHRRVPIFLWWRPHDLDLRCNALCLLSSDIFLSLEFVLVVDLYFWSSCSVG